MLRAFWGMRYMPQKQCILIENGICLKCLYGPDTKKALKKDRLKFQTASKIPNQKISRHEIRRTDKSLGQYIERNAAPSWLLPTPT